MELLSKLGIDPLHFVAQLVNVAVVIVVLRVFLYKPVLKMLNARRERIEKGLQEAKAAEEKLSAADTQVQKLKDQAQKEGTEIVSRYKDEGKKAQSQLLSQAQEDAQRLIEEAKKKANLKQEQAIEDAKKKVAQVSLLVAEKILEEEISAEKHKQLIDLAIKQL